VARLTGFFRVTAIGLAASAAACRILRRVPIVIGIAFAGALGALARYGLDELIGRRTGAFPWGIFIVNITGAFLIGFMVEALEPRFEDSWVRAAVVTGFLGAYTTFSTMAVETVTLVKDGRAWLGIAYLCFSIGAGLAAAYAGIMSGRKPTTRC